jgi:hypothetical protein
MLAGRAGAVIFGVSVGIYKFHLSLIVKVIKTVNINCELLNWQLPACILRHK